MYNGIMMTPIVIVESITSGISGYFNNAKPELFNMFFMKNLYFGDLEAKNLTFRYLACANSFGIEPGFGAKRAGSGYAISDRWKLESALRAAGIGKFTASGSTTTVTLRISEYLAQQASATAKFGLTPAKRDALVSEGKKLLGLPSSAFHKYYPLYKKYSAVGVRG